MDWHTYQSGDARDVGLIPKSGRRPGIRNSNPLQYSCLEKGPGVHSSWGHPVSDITEHTRTKESHKDDSSSNLETNCVMLSKLTNLSKHPFSHL